MDVILVEKVANLGDIGSIVAVKSGYGRNFLIPTGKAVSPLKPIVPRLKPSVLNY